MPAGERGFISYRNRRLYCICRQANISCFAPQNISLNCRYALWSPAGRCAQSSPTKKTVGMDVPIPVYRAVKTFPLGGRWIQKMSKNGHFLKTDEGKTKKNVPSSVKNQRFLTAPPPKGKLGGCAAGSGATAREMAICWQVGSVFLFFFQKTIYIFIPIVYDNGEQSRRCRVKCHRDGELPGGRRKFFHGGIFAPAAHIGHPPL